MPCHHSPPPPMVLKDGTNALHLAVCGNHPDVVKMLVDEFNMSLTTKNPVSMRTLNLTNAGKLTHAWLCMLVFQILHVFTTVLHIHMHTLHALKLGQTVFHIAAEENSRECLKLLVYHFKVDPDEPDFVSCNISLISSACLIVCTV